MASGVLARVEVPSRNGNPEDTAVMSFAFDHVGGDTPAQTAPKVRAALVAFFNTTQSNQKVAQWFAGTTTSEMRIKVYDLAGWPLLGDPVASYLDAFDNDTVSTDALPSEVAFCGSFNAALSGNNLLDRRRRGRIYLGPLDEDALGVGVDLVARPRETFRTDVLDALQDLMNDADTAWGVFSRSDNDVRPVVRVWVDNAWDTQRRRGVRATVRSYRP